MEKDPENAQVTEESLRNLIRETKKNEQRNAGLNWNRSKQPLFPFPMISNI